MATTNKVKGWTGVLMTEDSNSHWPIKGDVPPDVEFGVAAAPWRPKNRSAKQPSPEGDKEPPCVGNQRSE